MTDHNTTDAVLDCVADERRRQHRLKEAGKFPWTCADDGVDPGYKLAVLAEEFGEVAAIVNQRMGGDTTKPVPSVLELRKELIQVAAVAVAWAESLSYNLP